MEPSKRKSEEPAQPGSAAKKPKIDVAALRAKIAATKAKASKLPAASGAMRKLASPTCATCFSLGLSGDSNIS